MYSKEGWKKLVRGRAWSIEDNDWDITCGFYKSLSDLNLTQGGAKYLVWYKLSDKMPRHVMQCENMAKIVCKASELKSDDRKYKQGTFAMKSCGLCDNAAYEDVRHMVMTCQGLDTLGTQMFNELENNAECCNIWNQIRPDQTLETLLGGNPLNMPLNMMFPIWCVSMTWVNRMYRHLLKMRAGIG